MIYNFRDFLKAIDRAHTRCPIGFTSEEFNAIRSLTERDRIFKLQAQRYIIENTEEYKRLSNIALERERQGVNRRIDLDYQQADVHDPLLEGPRRVTRDWLAKKTSLTPIPVSISKDLYQEKQKELMSWVKDFLLDHPDCSILEDYISFIFIKFQMSQCTGAHTLFRAMAFLDATQSPHERGSPEDLKGRKESCRSLIDALYGAAIGRTGQTYIYPPYPYSCMPGAEERIIDLLTGIRCSLESVEDSLARKSFQNEDAHTEAQRMLLAAEQLVALNIDPFIRRDPLPGPSALFYAIYLHARYPQGWIIGQISGMKLTLVSKISEKYKTVLKSFQKSELSKVQRYQSLPSSREKRQFESQIFSYFSPLNEDETRLGSSRIFLSTQEINDKISNIFDEMYEQYQGQVIEQVDSSQEESFVIETLPSFIRELVEGITPSPIVRFQSKHAPLWSPQGILEYVSALSRVDNFRSRSLIEYDADYILERMAILSGCEHDSLEVLCRLSGSTESNLLGAFEVRHDRGDAIDSLWSSYSAVQTQIKAWAEQQMQLVESLNEYYGQYAASQLVFTNFLKNPNIWRENFFLSDKQHLRALPWMPEQLKKSYLFRAIEHGKFDIFKAILDLRPEWIAAEDSDRQGRGSLLVASLGYRTEEHHKITRLLIERSTKASLNIINNEGEMAVHQVLRCLDDQTFSLFVQIHGPDVFFLRNCDGCTALHQAVTFNNKSFIKRLLKFAPREILAMTNAAGNTALHDCVDYLQSCGPDSYNAYMRADYLLIIKMLIETHNLALLTQKNREGQTFLDIAEYGLHRDVIDFCRELPLECQGQWTSVAFLRWEVDLSNFSAAKSLFLEDSSILSIEDRYGRSPFNLALAQIVRDFFNNPYKVNEPVLEIRQLYDSSKNLIYSMLETQDPKLLAYLQSGYLQVSLLISLAKLDIDLFKTLICYGAPITSQVVRELQISGLAKEVIIDLMNYHYLYNPCDRNAQLFYEFSREQAIITWEDRVQSIQEFSDLIQSLRLQRLDLEREVLSVIEYGYHEELEKYSPYLIEQVVSKYHVDLTQEDLSVIKKLFPYIKKEPFRGLQESLIGMKQALLYSWEDRDQEQKSEVNYRSKM